MSKHTRQLERENLNPQANKAVLHPSKSNVHRLALGEVGNKIQNETESDCKVKELKPRAAGVVNKIDNNVTKNDCKVKELKPQAAGVVNKIHNNATKYDCKAKELIPRANNKKTNKVVTKSAAAGSKVGEKKTSANQKLPNFISSKVPLSYSTKQLREIIDVDTSDNPMRVSEYVQDIYKYLLELESRLNIEANFLDNHKTTPRMRKVLFNWMVQVHKHFGLLPETLHLSVAIVDRYLQFNKQIGKDTLQLVGTTALWIAGKYEDIFVPELTDFVHICDHAFTIKQFTAMEREMLKALDFNLGRPLSLQFLRRYSKIAEVNCDQHALGKYLLELGLFDCKLCHIKPSLQAAAACCLSISILDDFVNPSYAWSDMLVHYSHYLYKDIKPVIILMASTLKEAETTKYKSVHTKYSSNNLSKISLNPKLKGLLVNKLATQSCVSTKN